MGSFLAVSSSICMWVSTLTIVFAAMTPDAAALGVPMPGKHESPQRRRPSTGVFRFGKGKGMGVNLRSPA